MKPPPSPSASGETPSPPENPLPDLPAPASPSASSRRIDWRPKLRWFAAEYLIVVLGVLTAVALNAWWQGRQDAARERVYLLQLAEDLRETEQVLARADSLLRPNYRAMSRLLLSFGAPERPSRDSGMQWMGRGLRGYPTYPNMGTLEALVSTGDLALVRNDSLRDDIVTYLDATRMALRLQAASEEQLTTAVTALLGSVDFIEAMSLRPAALRDSLALARPSGIVPPSWWRSPFPLDVDAFVRDQTAYAALQTIAVWNQNLISSRRMHRTRAEALLERVEAELNR